MNNNRLAEISKNRNQTASGHLDSVIAKIAQNIAKIEHQQAHRIK